MMLMHGSFWWLLASGMVGLMLGYPKGIPRWGFLLGLFLAPLGWGLVMLFPTPNLAKGPPKPRNSAGEGRFQSSNPSPSTCSRCGKKTMPKNKVCAKCGNVLLPVRYKVHPDPEKS